MKFKPMLNRLYMDAIPFLEWRLGYEGTPESQIILPGEFTPEDMLMVGTLIQDLETEYEEVETQYKTLIFRKEPELEEQLRKGTQVLFHFHGASSLDSHDYPKRGVYVARINALLTILEQAWGENDLGSAATKTHGKSDSLSPCESV